MPDSITESDRLALAIARGHEALQEAAKRGVGLVKLAWDQLLPTVREHLRDALRIALVDAKAVETFPRGG